MPDTTTVMADHSETTSRELPADELSKLRQALDIALESRTNGSVVLTDEATKGIDECRGILEDLLANVADTKEQRKEQRGMGPEALAVISLAYGFVERGGDQPLVLSPTKLNGWLQKTARVIREINTEIRDGVPILGDRSAPFAVADSSEETLRALSHVLATRTQERVQLIMHDGVEAGF